MSLYRLILFFIVTIFLFSCDTDEEVIEISAQYLHIGHPRADSNPEMDTYVENLDYSPYEMLWLGGDLAYNTSVDTATMEYVDNILDLSNPNTILSIGNHDNINVELVEHFTKRPTFYTYTKNNICLLILDTQHDACNMSGDQLDLITQVTDTISNVSHLVILHHKLMWMYNNEALEPQIESVSNGKFGDCSYCLSPNNFNEVVYPKLVEVKSRGIEVICVGGDIGIRTKTFEHKTDDGIYFLASGIQAYAENNQVLLFKHNIEQKSLSWRFVLLSEL